MSQQQSSLEYMKRFSMCNCLTVHFPNTYTVHGVSADLINKKAQPGIRILQPYADTWEPHWGPRTIKIPKKIETFLYSPFNEALNCTANFRYPNFDNGEVRYSNGTVGELLERQGLAVRQPEQPAESHQQELYALEKHIETMWGSEVLKILVYYDYSRAQSHDIKRMRRYEKITREVFQNWPIIRVRLIGNEPKRNHKTGKANKGWLGWEHYKKPTRDYVLARIRALEELHSSD